MRRSRLSRQIADQYAFDRAQYEARIAQQSLNKTYKAAFSHQQDDYTASIGDATIDGEAISAQQQVVAKAAAATLHKHYPGPPGRRHQWGVECDTGMIRIFNIMLSVRYGYTIKLYEFATASELTREVVKAGGEILERFRQGRHPGATVDYSVRMSARGTPAPEL